MINYLIFTMEIDQNSLHIKNKKGNSKSKYKIS